MTLLRIYASLTDVPQHCQWALINNGQPPVAGEGRLADLPRRTERIQLVIPAAQVLITRARVPQAARRRSASTLAFAVEEKIAGEPDANQVSWLGSAGDEDVLAVVDKHGLARWRDALSAAGVRAYEVHCETLLLPWTGGEWRLAWNGTEGFVRTGEFEGAATDCGDRETPPLSLSLLLEDAEAHSAGVNLITVCPTTADAAPDAQAWTRELGIAVSIGEAWDWHRAAPEAGVSLTQERQNWRGLSGLLARLRTAAWILGAALTLHALALVADWTSLAAEQRALRQQMESRFRAAFPDAVAVVDPALQMRRKLAEAHHIAGQPDSGDFLPMIGKVSAALRDLPAGALRIVSFETGRLTLELVGIDAAGVQRLSMRLIQSGLAVEAQVPAQNTAQRATVITVRAS